MDTPLGPLSNYDLLCLASSPLGVLEGNDQTFCYANDAFCSHVATIREDVLGRPFREVVHCGEDCLQLLDQVFLSKRAGSYSPGWESGSSQHVWSFDFWPIPAQPGRPVRVVFQVTKMISFPEPHLLEMNEALLLSSLRQQELRENAETLATSLRSEVEERKRAQREIQHLAFYDPLTNLPNRRLLMDRLLHAIVVAARTMKCGAILFLDLDHFKGLNDTRGHDVGDVLLQQVAQRLMHCVRESDIVGRLGGDEFVVTLTELSADPEDAAVQARKVGEKILASLNGRYQLDGFEHNGTLSIGVALFDHRREAVEDLLRRADVALYRAKAAGGGAMRFFDPEMQALATARIILEEELKRGLQEKQFCLHYQTQVDSNGSVVGAEGLSRWNHPSRGLLLPAEFIPIAEESGLIKLLDQLALESACGQLIAWARQPGTSHLTLSVNVSAQEFCDPDFVKRVLAVIDRTGVDPTKLILEFTERVMFCPVHETLGKMLALKNCGVCFSLDDFGIGYSSLAYLKALPLDQLKIDKSFVRDVTTQPKDAAIVRSTISLGQSLGMTVIAEGVETVAQRDFLSQNGCNIYQGYLFGRPGPMENLAAMISFRPGQGA